MPGSKAPAHLKGTLPGDYGFDPLELGTCDDDDDDDAHAMGDRSIHGWECMGGCSIEMHGRVYVWVNSTVWLLRDLDARVARLRYKRARPAFRFVSFRSTE